ncbi:MAG TPA: lytic murein transglycosylase [Candidatus Dormibacteraeota bacterium]|nr:lytic murein transglycosylase [Candidatus Dormibacteraeota bacterium]
MLRWIALTLIGGVVLTGVVVSAFVLLAVQSVANLTFRPTQGTALAAYMAASRCNFTPDVKLSTAYLVAVAWVQNSDGALGFGHYRNPVGGGGDANVPADILAHVDRSALAGGGFTQRLLGLQTDLAPADWTTILPDVHGEHGVGFLLVQPSDWRQWIQQVPNAGPAGLDPFKPYDAFLAMACHLKGATAVAQGAVSAVDEALQAFGSGVMQFVDLVTQIVADDRDRPWMIPVDLLKAMPLPGTDRGLAFIGRIQSEMGNLGGGVVLWGPSAVALQDIPAQYLALVTKWAGLDGLDWTVLAGVLKVECDFGRNCGVSSAGALGPAQFEPGTWAIYGVDGDGDGRKDPWDAADAVASAANYLKALGAGSPAGVKAALCHYNAGSSPAFQACMDGTQTPDYADAVMAWAVRYRGPSIGGGTLPAVLPIPSPGWVQRIATPQWPADLPAHMSPSAVTNQCVAGALATWALMHTGDPRWNHPRPLLGNAIDLYAAAAAQGFQVSSQPVAGAMVVYGSTYGIFGHIATVRAVQGDRYEVIEQNFLDFNPSLEPHWQTFDLRSIAWPDPAVLGFVVAPT